MTKVVGVDPSLESTGIALRDSTFKVVSKPQKEPTVAERHTRILWVADSIMAACITADLVVIEAPAYAKVGGYKHERSGVWWLAVDNLIHWHHVHNNREANIVEVPPTVMKKYITGSGGAGKDDVIRCITKLFPWFEGGNDEADAMGFCAMGYDHIGQPLVKLPAVQRKVLDSVKWND